MLNKAKELMSKYKIQVAFAGGALVVATVFGTCTFDPSETSSDASEDAAGDVGAQPVSETNATTEETNATTEEANAATEEAEVTTE